MRAIGIALILSAPLTMSMPGAVGAAVWGAEYRLDAQASHMDVPYDPEAFVRTRVLALSAYLNRLQAK
jgi:hypothetical protein